MPWSWYCGERASTTDETLDSATGSTFVVTEDLVGRYLEARADGGSGKRDSSAAGPVVKAGSVELYKVEVPARRASAATLTAKAYEKLERSVSGQRHR